MPTPSPASPQQSFACDLFLVSYSITTDSLSLCDYANYHIAMLIFFGSMSLLMTCVSVVLVLCYGRNPTPVQEDTVELCIRWALGTLILALGFEGAFALFYAFCFVTILGSSLYICAVALHRATVRAVRLLVRGGQRDRIADAVVVEGVGAGRVVVVVVAVDTNCPICLEGAGEGTWHTTSCGHAFHDACLRKWRRGTCPLCRAQL